MKADLDKDIADIKRPAQRMAGIVGGLGTLAGAALLNKDNKEAAAERAEMKSERLKLQEQSSQIHAEGKAFRESMRDYIAGGMKGPMPGAEAYELPGSTDTSKPAATPATPSASSSLPASPPTSPKPTTVKSSGGSATSFGSVYQMAKNSGAAYPQLVAAQWALESDYGKKPSGTNNFFGIKATDSESSTSKPTWEVRGGKNVTETAQFKNFNTPQGSVDHLVTQWHKNYKNYSGVNNAPNARAAADMLLQENYATDPAYAEKLKRIMKEQGY